MCGRWNKSAFQLGEVISMHSHYILCYSNIDRLAETELLFMDLREYPQFSLGFLKIATHETTYAAKYIGIRH